MTPDGETRAGETRAARRQAERDWSLLGRPLKEAYRRQSRHWRGAYEQRASELTGGIWRFE